MSNRDVIIVGTGPAIIRDAEIASLRTQLAEATARAERAERDAVVVRDGHWDAVIAERDEARAQLAEAREDAARYRELYGRSHEWLCDAGLALGDVLIPERTFDVPEAAKRMRERAEQAESRVLSDETARTVRKTLRMHGDDDGTLALAELDRAYPEAPKGCDEPAPVTREQIRDALRKGQEDMERARQATFRRKQR